MFSTPILLDQIRRWVEIETPTERPDQLNRLVDEVMADHAGLPVSLERIAGSDGCGDHLVVRSNWGQSEPGILVLSHLDTVHPVGFIQSRLPFRVEGNSAFGPGIYDMKAGANLAHNALRATAQAGGGPLGITHLYVSDEEIGSPTSRPLIEEFGKKAKYVLVTEPARDGGKIVTARKGIGCFEVKIHGKASHAGAKPLEGRSAVRELGHVILALEGLSDEKRGITVTVGVVSGGTKRNIIPDFAQAQVDLRVPDAEAAQDICARILGLQPKTSGVTLTITGGISRPPFEQSPGAKLLFDHAHAVAAEIGFVLEGVSTGGGSDGNFTAPYAPTLDGLGPDGLGAHTDHEQIFIDTLAPRAALLAALFQALR
ncbi:M20 family metallopeptidase [Bradyrhizobium oligotrophicum]|uniref:M20 family metallopeptidase n=1 Tax=Bradyrhizobium oligotrophicum TaxID=44255 RepID=UPI003EBC1127